MNEVVPRKLRLTASLMLAAVCVGFLCGAAYRIVGAVSGAPGAPSTGTTVGVAVGQLALVICYAFWAKWAWEGKAKGAKYGGRLIIIPVALLGTVLLRAMATGAHRRGDLPPYMVVMTFAGAVLALFFGIVLLMVASRFERYAPSSPGSW